MVNIMQWTDNYFTTTENQSIIWLPMNKLTQKFYYNSQDTTKNMRLVMSSPGLERPIVWQISKIESAQPMGINKITLYQTEWNPNTDYIDKEEIEAGDLFAMYANYYTLEGDTVPTDEKDESSSSTIYGEIACSSVSVKVGGSYRTLTFNIFNNETNITSEYSDRVFKWLGYIGEDDVTNIGLITWVEGATPNITRIKLSNDRSVLGKTLKVYCVCEIDNGDKIVGEIQLNITAL